MPTQHTIIDALESEWPIVASSSDARARLSAWRIAEPELADFPAIGVIVSEIQRMDQPDSVPVMGALIRLATSEPLARRAVLQVMIPVMCGRIRTVRDACARAGVEIDLDEAAQIVVNHDGHGHRTGRGAQFLREQLTQADIELIPPSSPQTVTLGDLRDVLVRAARSGVVSECDAQLVWLTRVGGWETHELTDRFGATRDTLLRRRSRAERAIAKVA